LHWRAGLNSSGDGSWMGREREGEGERGKIREGVRKREGEK
jgi:hypothetical protein